jgi:hypothetical protein
MFEEGSIQSDRRHPQMAITDQKPSREGDQASHAEKSRWQGKFECIPGESKLATICTVSLSDEAPLDVRICLSRCLSSSDKRSAKKHNWFENAWKKFDRIPAVQEALLTGNVPERSISDWEGRRANER